MLPVFISNDEYRFPFPSFIFGELICLMSASLAAATAARTCRASAPPGKLPSASPAKLASTPWRPRRVLLWVLVNHFVSSALYCLLQSTVSIFHFGEDSAFLPCSLNVSDQCTMCWFFATASLFVHHLDLHHDYWLPALVLPLPFQQLAILTWMPRLTKPSITHIVYNGHNEIIIFLRLKSRTLCSTGCGSPPFPCRLYCKSSSSLVKSRFLYEHFLLR